MSTGVTRKAMPFSVFKRHEQRSVVCKGHDSVSTNQSQRPHAVGLHLCSSLKMAWVEWTDQLLPRLGWGDDDPKRGNRKHLLSDDGTVLCLDIVCTCNKIS